MKNNPKDLHDSKSKDQKTTPSTPENNRNNSGKTTDLNHNDSGSTKNSISRESVNPGNRENKDYNNSTYDTPVSSVKSKQEPLDKQEDDQELKNKNHPHKRETPESDDDYAHDM